MRYDKGLIALTSLGLSSILVAQPELPTQYTVGGQEVVKAEHNWVGRTEACTGSLVAGKWHLTAAHCYEGDKIYHDDTAFNPTGVEVFNVLDKVRHPEFCAQGLGLGVSAQDCLDNEWHKAADVALWEMDRPLGLTEIVPIGLDSYDPSTSAKMRLYGYGHSSMWWDLETSWLPLHYVERWTSAGPYFGCTPTSDDFRDSCWLNNFLMWGDLASDTDVVGGTSRGGDSGGPYVVDGEIVAVHVRKATPHPDPDIEWTYLQSANLSANGTRDWIAETVNNWHAPTLAFVSGAPVEVTVQSIFVDDVVDTAVTSGDVTIDTSASTCVTQGVIASFDVCTYVLESNGGAGTVDLGGFEIEVNPVVEIALENGVEMDFSGSAATIFSLPINADINGYSFNITGLPDSSRVLAKMGSAPTGVDFDHDVAGNNGVYTLNVPSEGALNDTWYIKVEPAGDVSNGKITATYSEFVPTHTEGPIYMVGLDATESLYISDNTRVTFEVATPESKSISVNSNHISGDSGVVLYYDSNNDFIACSEAVCQIDNINADNFVFYIQSTSSRLELDFVVKDAGTGDGGDNGGGDNGGGDNGGDNGGGDNGGGDNGGDNGTGDGNVGGGNDNSSSGGGSSMGLFSLLAMLLVGWRRSQY